ncbi:urate hydroxylase PuuD [Porticoccaceae bacterium]|nr:urate hydroxylase PuuD [Porticoccaceae bacterium]
MTIETINFIARWGHVLFGITWIGMLYYFNFVQGGYFKQATPEGLADAKQKLAPSALWWFRWGAMFTFLTGIVLLGGVQHYGQMNNYIIIGSTMGIIMAANVWMVIWPAQKIALGMVEGDAPAAGAKALLASRSNTLLSAPMLFAMLAGPHYAGHGYGTAVGGTGLIAALVVIGVLEANAIKGRLGPIASVRGVIVSSLVLTAVFALMINML